MDCGSAGGEDGQADEELEEGSDMVGVVRFEGGEEGAEGREEGRGGGEDLGRNEENVGMCDGDGGAEGFAAGGEDGKEEGGEGG